MLGYPVELLVFHVWLNNKPEKRGKKKKHETSSRLVEAKDVCLSTIQTCKKARIYSVLNLQ